jgi:hypothetical protein
LIEKAATPPRIRHKSRPTIASKLERLRDKRKRADIKKLRTHASPDD